MGWGVEGDTISVFYTLLLLVALSFWLFYSIE